jgi:hypothetical protein
MPLSSLDLSNNKGTFLYMFFIIIASLLIPMDGAQTDHLKAYGLTYWVLKEGLNAEWLLNYRGGSFLLPGLEGIKQEADQRGVTSFWINEDQVNDIYSIIERENMERVKLEKAPKVAVYIPETEGPWDDAVALALEYARIPYERIWDDDILKGVLTNYDWLHLHHEDFTGQYGKFYRNYANTYWYREVVNINERKARSLGYSKVWQMKHDVAQTIKSYVSEGGFLFAMCSAPITLDIALSYYGVDIVPSQIDGDGIDSKLNIKADYNNTLFLKNIGLITSLNIYEHSDVDITYLALRRGKNSYFFLRTFMAKRDIIPAILTQNHTERIKEFLGQDTGFNRDKLKENTIVLGDVPNTKEVRYVYGECGKGSFSFFGGHDPEDYAHLVGDPPTYLEFYKNSPGYRLILNNLLLPAVKKKKLKT